MDTILTGNIWKHVATWTSASKRRLVAVAYVTDTKHVGFKDGDLLICDASDRAIRAGETSATALKSLVREGVEVRSRADLHAKVAVFGRHALIGSCNLSTTSAEVLTELALATDRHQVVSQATAFIHGLRKASEQVGDEFLRRILKIRVRKHQVRRRSPARRRTRFGSRVWLVSVKELPEGAFPNEESLVQKAEKKAVSFLANPDSEISWIRWTGKARFRELACPGDTIIQVLRSLSGKRSKVYPPCPLVFRQDTAHWTRFYLAGPDTPESIPWSRFERQAKKLGFSRISRNSIRELSPREELIVDSLWTE